MFADVLQNSCSKDFAKFTRKHLCWVTFLIKLWLTLLKKRLRDRCFAIFLKTPFFTDTSPPSTASVCKLTETFRITSSQHEENYYCIITPIISATFTSMTYNMDFRNFAFTKITDLQNFEKALIQQDSINPQSHPLTH